MVDKLSELFVRSMKLLLFTYFLYHYGFIIAIFLHYLTNYLYNYLIYLVFNSADLSNSELLLAPLPYQNNLQVVAIIS